MTYSEYKVRCGALISENSEATDADNEAVTLICAVCGKSYAEYLTCRRTSHLTDEEFAVLEEKVRRRAEGEPLQYVIGEWDFHGLPMYCGKGCLIPRFETEMLVERAAKVLPRGGRFLELCVGSGCVSAAILKKRSDVSGDGIDISKPLSGTLCATPKGTVYLSGFTLRSATLRSMCRRISTTLSYRIRRM